MEMVDQIKRQKGLALTSTGITTIRPDYHSSPKSLGSSGAFVR